MKNGLLNGLIAAAIFSTLYILVNSISPKLNFTFTYTFISTVVIYLIFMVRASNQEGAVANEFYGFGDALIPAMICYAVASLVYSIFTFIMFKFDPMLLEYAQEASIESIEFFANLIGDQDGAMVEQMEGNQEGILKNFTSFGTYCVNWFVGLVFPGLILGAIAAKIARKRTTTT